MTADSTNPNTSSAVTVNSTKAADRYFNRELSWLEFDQRVLEQGADAAQPLLERLKFLAITSSNLDEFSMVRVGSLKMQAEQNPAATDLRGRNVFEQMQDVALRCRQFQKDQYRILMQQLEPALVGIGIRRIELANANQRYQEAAESFFQGEVLPVLSPQVVDPDQPFPLLQGLQIQLCVKLKSQLAVPEVDESAGYGDAVTLSKNKNKKKKKSKAKGSDEEVADAYAGLDFAVVPLGRMLPRIVPMPAETGYAYALLEDVVSRSIDQFFPGREILEVCPFRITRNADVELREDSAADLMAGMGEVLESRKASAAVRLEIDQAASEDMCEFLRYKLELETSDVYRSEGPLDLTYLFAISTLTGFDAYRDPSWPPQGHALIDPRESMFMNMAKQDILLVHPYERFDPIVRLIEEAASDPDVLAIKQVLYRTSRQSPIVTALMKAAERGKYVTVVVELKARFDEARNIGWAREMEHAGVQVIYGVKGLKTHAKVCVIVRREARGIVRYLHFGTGNYNEVTSRLYSDISLLTCNEELGADASAFFNAITGASQVQQFQHIAAAPLTLRRRVIALIDDEAARCRDGQRAKIYAKLNALVDAKMIEALYRASQAGVKIRLNIRGVCCLRPGVPGLSENIEVTSIVDRYLEHARILYFYQGGAESMFISSADWMPRNLDRRIELLIPVLDGACRKKLWRILDTYFHDNVASWRLLPDGSYRRLKPSEPEQAYRAQRKLYERAVQESTSNQPAQTATFEPHQSSSPLP